MAHCSAVGFDGEGDCLEDGRQQVDSMPLFSLEFPAVLRPSCYLAHARVHNRKDAF